MSVDKPVRPASEVVPSIYEGVVSGAITPRGLADFIEADRQEVRAAALEEAAGFIRANEATIAEYAADKWKATKLCAFLIDSLRALATRSTEEPTK